MNGTRTFAPVAAVVATLTLALGGLVAPAAGASGAGASSSSRSLPAIHAVPDPVNGGRFVDARGREVVLRGVNVNALVEYWRYGRFPTTFPLTSTDADLIAAQGWNVVRLAVSWSRVEPQPGVYDERYVDAIARAVRLFASRGVYSIVDLHQDAWGPTLAAPAGTTCPAGTNPAFGWDGAPGWATLDGGATRCAAGDVRETSRAVLASFAAFWSDAAGPGGVGVRTRYAAMLGHLAARFARDPAVVGYDLMNEPNAFNAAQLAGLSALATASLAEIRRNETTAGGFPHVLFFEPAPLWPAPGFVPPSFAHDGQVAYAPHIYNGGLSSGPIPPGDFDQATADAASFGGAPVLVGEWGGDPHRASDPTDGYFEKHQALQDQHRFSSTLWTWRESCGDPHKAADARDGRVPYVWGEFEVDCTTNTVTGPRTDLVAALHRAFVRAAPGRLVALYSDPAAQVLVGAGRGAGAGVGLEAYVPLPPSALDVATYGLGRVAITPAPGGASVRAPATGGNWVVVVRPKAG